ncbi:TPM domain-containing protein [Bifidobacterium leontopitheci]|nr:hypothetical protein [Bifidobacterium leontopitheci]
MTVAATAVANAADDDQATFSQDVTDPFNVLGSNLSKVTDAISRTYKSTGVSVKLSYMEHFQGADDPDQWAQESLDATNPKPNTVLLAAALNDGKIVVAVSGNSESWLHSRHAADELLKSAYTPVSGKDPDWAGSATALMDTVARLKTESENAARMWIWITIGAVVVVLVIAIVVVVIIVRRRRASAADRWKAAAETVDSSRPVSRRERREALRKGRRRKSKAASGE